MSVNISQTSKYIDVAESAKMIRALLKVKFPGVKFSVKSSRYAGGSSIRVEWTDGPTRREVEQYTDPFEGQGFDGMIDMAYYKTSYQLPDGTVVFGQSIGTEGSLGSHRGYQEPLPEGAIKVHFGSDYVHVTRNYSDEFLSARVDEYKATFADGKYVIFNPSTKQSWGVAGPSIDVKPWQSDVREHIGRFVEGYSGYTRN